MQATPRVFSTLDLGAATTAAALIGRIDRRWRLLGALSVPSTVPSDHALEQLADRIRAADPELADAVGLNPTRVAGMPSLIARSAPPKALAVLATTDRVLDGLAAVLARSGWRWTGLSAERHDVAALTASALEPSVGAVLVAAGEPPGSDERAAVSLLGALAAALVVRRPEVAIALAGAVARAGPASAPAVADGESGSREDHTARFILAPPAAPGAPPWTGLSELLAPLRVNGADSRQGIARSVTGLAGALDRRVELLELGFDGGLRAAAAPGAVAGAGNAVAVTVADAALVPADVDEVRLDRILRWFTLPLDRHRLRDRLLELRTLPWTGWAGDGATLRLAAARAALERLVELTPDVDSELPPDLVVIAGGIFAPLPGAVTMLCVADVIRRPGAYQIAFDHARLLGPLGTIEDPAERDRLLADLAGDLLLPLGAVVMPGGLRPGQRGGMVAVAGPGGRTEVPLVIGSLERYSLPAGRHASVIVESGEPVRLGRSGRRIGVDVAGGIGGLLIDLRDVPLRLPERRESRRELLRRWQETAWPESAA